VAAPSDSDYWTHNTAYHPWLVGIAAEHRGDVLDVGCGDGLLASGSRRCRARSRVSTPIPRPLHAQTTRWRHIDT
jgi:predicted RNA methylase